MKVPHAVGVAAVVERVQLRHALLVGVLEACHDGAWCNSWWPRQINVGKCGSGGPRAPEKVLYAEEVCQKQWTALS